MRLKFFLFVFLCTASISEQLCFAEIEQSVIRLGATVPLSGEFASDGSQIRDGIELAARNLKTRGILVTVDYEDVPTSASPADVAIEKLLTGKIKGLVANFWSAAIPSMVPSITRSGIVAFQTGTVDDVTINAGDEIVSTNTSIRDEARHLVKYLYNDTGVKSVCILYSNTAAAENYQRYFAEEFTLLGGTLPYTEHAPLNREELRGSLTKVKGSSCDVFFASFPRNELGILLRESAAVGIAKPIVTTSEAEDNAVLTVAGAAVEGIRFFIAEASKEMPASKKFQKEFSERFGYSPGTMASNAYDASTILATALYECSGDTACTLKKIYALKNYEGVSGVFSMKTDGTAEKNFALRTVKNR